ncbi:MAG: hypothetical protein PHI97_00770 [Desulfobulbus sp.]|nr:hypothetical protein [Desulfobulbus sp.]
MRSNPEIEYTDYYVAFLDILGFKELAKSKNREDKKKIYTYFQLINSIINDLKQIDVKKNIGSIVISDSVILSVQAGFDQSENIKILRQLCIAVQKIQFQLAEINLWLRGGISSGEAYFSSKDSQVVGPAYVNAYLLEERVAVYPRVILDNNLVVKLKLESAQELIDKVNHDNSCSSEYNAIERNILFQWIYNGGRKSSLTQDVALFVDYLIYAFENKSKLERIVNNIKKSIYLDNGIYSKFRWVTDYLLASCQHHSDHAGCGIPNEELMKQYRIIQKL